MLSNQQHHEIPPPKQQQQQHIPSDIYFHIMQFLEWKQIVSTCSLISKDWQSQALNIKFKFIFCTGYTSLLFTPPSASLNWLQNIIGLNLYHHDGSEILQLKENLHRMKSLKSLILQPAKERYRFPDEIAQLMTCKELEQLKELRVIYGCDIIAQAIAECSYLRNLEILEYIGTHIDENGVSIIATSPYLKNLKEVIFFGSLTVDDCRTISENLEHLERFTMFNCNVECFKYIVTLRKLKSLDIRRGIVCLDDLNVESMSNLETIRLLHTTFDSSKIKILGSNTFKNLSNISITFNRDFQLTTDNDFCPIFTDNLRKLFLFNIAKELVNKIIILIAKNLRNLTELSIADVEDKDLKSFVDNIDKQSSLKSLQIAGEITDKGIAYISKSNYLNQIDSLKLENDQCTILSINHVALSTFSNTIKSLSYTVGDEMSDIEKKINNWKSKNKLTNLVKTMPKTNSLKRELPNYLEKGQQTITSMLKKKKK